mmetsp:Transcript_3699/g.5927  ORF Transcript_3699/g.5927 Transcript_3699/m.5927 type:complete len:235 (+) Transcript_3699:390-1094(+)
MQWHMVEAPLSVKIFLLKSTCCSIGTPPFFKHSTKASSTGSGMLFDAKSSLTRLVAAPFPKAENKGTDPRYRRSFQPRRRWPRPGQNPSSRSPASARPPASPSFWAWMVSTMRYRLRSTVNSLDPTPFFRRRRGPAPASGGCGFMRRWSSLAVSRSSSTSGGGRALAPAMVPARRIWASAARVTSRPSCSSCLILCRSCSLDSRLSSAIRFLLSSSFFLFCSASCRSLFSWRSK